MTARRGAAPRPDRVEALDPDMRALWDRLGPMPADLRLYGGTALMLYLGHRQSVDFDFATPRPVIDREFVRRLAPFDEGRVAGGPGMVDVALQGPTREIRAAFMECGHLIPPPTRKALAAPNGVAVAHPVDLVAAKIEVCMDRGAQRDFEDVAAAIRAWPGWARLAARSLVKADRRRMRDIRGTLASPPRAVARALPAADRRRLRRFASSLLSPDREAGR